MLQFSCPCGKALHARDEYAGETTKCPDCGRELTIPGGQGRLTADAPRGPARSPDAGVRRSRPGRPDERETDERPRSRPPITSGMAVGSAILGVLSLFVCSLFTGIPAIIMGALGLRAIGASEGRIQGRGLAITGLVTGGLSLLLTPVAIFLLLIPAVGTVRQSANKIASSNNLKQISLGLIEYGSSYGSLPPAGLPSPTNPSGKEALLSWRVAILPYIEQNNLYSQFKLDESWDGPNNSRLIPLMPKTYALPGDTTAPPGYTYYRVFVGEHTAFPPPRSGDPFGGPPHGARYPNDFLDGTSNTILVVEAATAVPWTKPDAELSFDPIGPLPPLGGHFTGGFQAAMGDGAVRMVPSAVSQQTLRNAIQLDDGNVLGSDW